MPSTPTWHLHREGDRYPFGVSPLTNRRFYIPGLIALAAFSVGVYTWQSSGSDGRELAAAAANCPPVARNDAAFTAPGEPVTIDVLANDTDADGDELVFTVIRASDGTAEVDDGGTPSDERDDLLRYTPSDAPEPTASIRYRVEDSAFGTSTAEITVAITDAGALPAELRSADPSESNGDIVDPQCATSGDEDGEDDATSTSLDGSTTSIDGLSDADADADPAVGTSRTTTVTRKGTTGRVTTTTARRSTTTVTGGGGGSPPPDFETPPPTQRQTTTTRRPTTSRPPSSGPTTTRSTTRPSDPCYDQASCEEYFPTRP